MAWALVWSVDAAVSLSKLEKRDARRIVEKLELAAKNPQHFLERLVGQDDYKLRVGQYRILCTLLHSKNAIFIEAMGHRKKIYKTHSKP